MSSQSPDRRSGESAIFRIEAALMHCRRDLSECQRRNRLGAEGVNALLAVRHERPQSWEAQYVTALADVLVSIHADLTGVLPDDGGEFRPDGGGRR